MLRFYAAAIGLAALAAPAWAQPNSPPVPVGIADGDVFETPYEVTRTINFSFTSPEAGQTTTITYDDPDGVVFGDDLTPGNPAMGELSFRVSASSNTSSGFASDVEITACDNATPSECTVLTITVVILDPPVVACTPAAPVSIVGFDADGVGSPFGEFVEFFTSFAAPTPPRVDLTTCTLLAFDVMTGQATFAYTPTTIASVFQDVFYIAGDPGIPPGFLPDGPGAFALVEGDIAVGTDILDVVDDIVAGAVYGGDGSEIERIEGPVTAEERADFLDALGLFRNAPPVPVGIADGDVFQVEVGAGLVTVPFSFTSPEAGQTTTITSPDFDGSGFPTGTGNLDVFEGIIEFETTPGNPATGQIEASVPPALGLPTDSYEVRFEACDDGPAGGACTMITVTIDVVFPETVTCGPDVNFYVLDFGADVFRIYSFEPGPLDFSNCSFVALDAATEEVVLVEPLTYTLQPFTEPEVNLPPGSIPAGPGAVAVVEGTPAVGTDVLDLLGTVAHAVVYYDYTTFFGGCGQLSPLVSPVEPCGSAAGDAALAEALARLGVAVDVEDAPVADLALRVAPNPLSGRGAVTLDLPAAVDVRVAVYDALGREVAVVADRAFGPGRHEAPLDAAALPAGIYVVRAVVGAEVRTAPVTIVR